MDSVRALRWRGAPVVSNTAGRRRDPRRLFASKSAGPASSRLRFKGSARQAMAERNHGKVRKHTAPVRPRAAPPLRYTRPTITSGGRNVRHPIRHAAGGFLPLSLRSAAAGGKDIMPNKMLIDASHPEETRVVVVRGNRIEEFDFEIPGQETAQRKYLSGPGHPCGTRRSRRPLSNMAGTVTASSPSAKSIPTTTRSRSPTVRRCCAPKAEEACRRGRGRRGDASRGDRAPAPRRQEP